MGTDTFLGRRDHFHRSSKLPVTVGPHWPTSERTQPSLQRIMKTISTAAAASSIEKYSMWYEYTIRDGRERRTQPLFPPWRSVNNRLFTDLGVPLLGAAGKFEVSAPLTSPSEEPLRLEVPGIFFIDLRDLP